MDGALRRQLIAGSSASLGALSACAVFAWIAPVLPKFLAPDSEVPMTHEEASWMVTMPETTGLLSSLPAGLLADRYGRKVVILAAAPISFIGWIVFLYFKTLWALNLGRLIQGIGVGIVYTVTPTYLGEIASPKYRGAISSMFFSIMSFGYLLVYILGSLMREDYFTSTCACFNVLFFGAFIWQPESPYYYLMRKDQTDARNSLMWFMNTSDANVDVELERIKNSVDEDTKEKVSWKDLIKTSADRKALSILFFVGTVRHLSGVTSFSSFSTQTLSATGDAFFLSPDNVTIVMGVFLFVGSVCGSFTIDYFGRRTLMIWSSLIATTLNLFSGTYYLMKSRSTLDGLSLTWVPPLSVVFISGAAMAGISPVSTAYCSELFLSKTRGIASSIYNIYGTLIALLVLRFYLPMFYTFGTFVNFYLFSGACFLGVLVSCLCLPETKGKTFEQIRKELDKHK